MSQAVNRCFVLKQKETDFRSLKKGDLFQLETRDPEGNVAFSEWCVALNDAREDPEHPGQFVVPSDRIYFVVGKPEISTVAMRQIEIPKTAFSVPAKEKAH